MAFQVTRDREELYRLIVGQLRFDGLEAVAGALAKAIHPNFSAVPSPRLAALIQQALLREQQGDAREDEEGSQSLDLDSMGPGGTRPAANYKTVFVTAHKGPCRAAAFSRDGKMAATAASDASIKLLDTQRMLSKQESGEGDTRPVIRTLFDHTQPITCVAFHPNDPYLVSGGEDSVFKVYDLSKMNQKRAAKTINEIAPIRSLAFHPAGKHLLVATDHPVIRLYDFATMQCYATAGSRDNHTGCVTSVCMGSDGRSYASGSTDGQIKVWDIMSSRCVATWTDAHSGAEVDSVCLSSNMKYLLSLGKDNSARLWDVASGRVINTFEVPHNKFTSCAAFSHTEDFMFVPDESNNHIVVFDTRTGERVRSLHGHTDTVRSIATNSNVPGFLSAADDYRARFWVHEAI
eukprot:comp17545_c0_seq1/m.17123 comp17545_c0_seq1/g.17123  ORF comp17545_c0_seq1/g.17123 comp17545_c0_seq1/m.17123 type:complete len:405 (-) comp17545_c0_seq1:630-1844(-)